MKTPNLSEMVTGLPPEYPVPYLLPDDVRVLVFSPAAWKCVPRDVRRSLLEGDWSQNAKTPRRDKPAGA